MQSVSAPPSVNDAQPQPRLVATFLALQGLISAPLLLTDTMLPPLAASALLAIFLAVLSAIDWRDFRLPDVLTLPLLGAGLVLAALASHEAFIWAIVSALVGGGALYAVGWIYRRYRGRTGLGLGDVKLFAGAGAWVGAEGLAAVLLVACVTALAAALTWRLRKGEIDPQRAIPFGPFIDLGLWVVWLYGPLVSYH